MNTLGYIPLDCRPIHLQHFNLFAFIKGWKVKSPTPALLGTVDRGMQPRKVLRWVEDLPSLPQQWLISIEALSYGGLLQAREPTATFHTAFQQLAELLGLLKKKGCRVVAFGFLPRLAPSVTCKEDLPHWEQVQRALKKTSLSIFSPFDKWRKKWRALPDHLLETLYFVRRRNFSLLDAVLKSYVPIPIEHLLLLQEDSSPGGLQKTEIAALKATVRRFGLKESVTLQTGGDEAPYLLFASLAAPQPASAHYLFFPPELAACPARYEDKPQGKVWQEKWRYLSFKRNLSATPIHIYTSRSQRDLLFQAPLHSTPSVSSARMVVDNLHCNGGSLALLDTFARISNAETLPLFFGWNTFANKAGMALATLKLLLSHPNNKPLRMFQVIRILDDYLYQASLRPRLQAECQQRGWDFWNFASARNEVEGWLEAQLQREWPMWQKKLPLLRGRSVPKILFPFGRGFEATIRV